MSKPLRAWAIVNSDGKIDCYDERVPVFWIRRCAREARRQKSFEDSRVKRVDISIVERKQA